MNPQAPHISSLVQAFFSQHLHSQKRVSLQTIASYRDTFRLLLQFVHRQSGIQPSSLRLSDLAAPTVLQFLDDLEHHRHNCIRTRNLRLAAIHTFFRFVAFQVPMCLDLATQVLAIPVKRTDHKLVGSLTREEIEAILAAPDRASWTGRRDYALLLTIYNSGARVSEVTALHQNQVQFGCRTYLAITGKGRKERTLPLWNTTSSILQTWFQELTLQSIAIASPNRRGGSLSRDGVDYILKSATAKASLKCPSLCGKPVSPHTLRHTTAMHLLQAGVDISVIALWLGHESLETTHVYIEADLATKERALEKLNPFQTPIQRFKPDDALLAFLALL